MAGSALIVSTDNLYMDVRLNRGNRGDIRVGGCILTLDWTSDSSSGDLDLSIVDAYNTAVLAGDVHLPFVTKIHGKIISVETIPGEEGDPAETPPSADYDIKLKDAYSYDLAGANLQDLSNTDAEMWIPTTPVPVSSDITLFIENAGNSKKGRIIITLTE